MAMKNPSSSLCPQLTLLVIIIFSRINGQEFTIQEATIEGIQRAFEENKLTSRQLVDFYLQRIEILNPILRSVIEVNPDAQDQADEADRQRKGNQGRSLYGELHGIPVLVKDSIATKDKLNTTAGSYALLGSVVPRDAGVVKKLREAGAVILGKASLTEWYSFRGLGQIPNGWCARAGQGLKPTVGLTSRAGVIPVLPRHDTIGSMSRTVMDAVYVLDAIVGFDQHDYEATKEAAKFIPPGGYKQFLNLDGIRGKRLGVVRSPFIDSLNKSSVSQAFENHLNTLRERGATIVDNLEIENVDVILSPKRSGELTAMLAEFKLSLNDYLKELIASPVRSLAEVIAFNNNNPDLEKTKEYGQATFIASEKTTGFGEKEREAVELMKNLSREGFEKLILENALDALVTPGTGAIAVLAIGGHPGITVPAGYDKNGMPFGICFGGLKGTEPKLIETAYAFEQATKVRKPPFSISFKMDDKDLFGIC
ncbi:probable amidase At4g34880 isoform X2 [Ziziphus jujuba]|uniref:Probable amidase At4g34880 isoform X2 n=1 Tax=Ziziphus jujuba TaxID=326968 RepID=A0A6P4AAW7_ZIZJJ|nr:probable amidase At4g34880 isoform X2 [Ziziphus jujuba]